MCAVKTLGYHVDVLLVCYLRVLEDLEGYYGFYFRWFTEFEDFLFALY